MKKVSAFILSTLIASLVSTTCLAATNSTSLPNPGITPDSPFYFLDKWMEDIDLFFTFPKEAKAEKRLQFAEERLAEAQKMAQKGDLKALKEAEEGYEADIDDATKDAKEAAKEGKENALEQVQEATAKHKEEMQEVLSKAPEQAKESIQQAIEKSAKGHEDALEAIKGEKKETPEKEKSDSPKEKTEKPATRTENGQ